MDDNYCSEEPEIVKSEVPSNPPPNYTTSIIGLVIGVFGVFIVLCCYPLGLLLGTVAVICGFVAKSKNQRFAVASIVLGFVAIGLGFFTIVLGIFGSKLFINNPEWQEFINKLQQTQ